MQKKLLIKTLLETCFSEFSMENCAAGNCTRHFRTVIIKRTLDACTSCSKAKIIVSGVSLSLLTLSTLLNLCNDSSASLTSESIDLIWIYSCWKLRAC